MTLFTPSELAGQLKVDISTVYRWQKARKIPFIVLPGGDIRYKQEAIEEWLNSRTVSKKKNTQLS